jgi:hypothetical protein
MFALHFAEYAAAILAVAGLAAVIYEVAVKSPHSLLELISDSRRFAEPPAATADFRPQIVAENAAPRAEQATAKVQVDRARAA